jgi:hypothetical protein
MDYTTLIATLSLALGSAWCSGINVYATVAMLGLLHRYAEGFVLPEPMQVLAHDMVVWPALLLYVIEFVADKVPAVDSVWDVVHTFIRVPAGAVLAAMALGNVPLEWQILAGLLGGGVALGAHTAKATARLAAHSTGTSPVVGPAASVAEDVSVVGLLALMTVSPALALVAVVLMIAGAAALIYVCWRIARSVYTRFRAWIRGTTPPPSPEPAR